MKAIIWKELKENLKWAVLAALGLGLAYAYVLSQAFGNYQTFNPYQVQGLPMPTDITAPIVGLLLGLMQIIPELRRDQWAFLMHRPVPRATIFWGKVSAGLLLFLLAMGLPFFGAVLWLATPGRMAAPFDWRLALSGTVDILTGIIFYFAGVLTALRPARWYGSRAFGIAAAAICFLAVTQMPSEFWQALLILAVSAGVLLLAARGSFLTSGEYDGQPKLAKVALGTTLFTGSAVVCCAAIALLITMGSTLVPRYAPPYVYTDYAIDKTGRILRVTRSNGLAQSLADLNGKPVALPKLKNGDSYNFQQLGDQVVSLPPEHRSAPSYRTPSRYYLFLEESRGEQGTIRWYYDKDRGVIAGYSNYPNQDKRLIGYLAPGGFVRAGDAGALTRLQRFPGPLLSLDVGQGYTGRIFAFPLAAYLVDLQKRIVRQITATKPAQPIQGAVEARYDYNYPRVAYHGIIVVATDEQVQGYAPHGKLMFSMPREEDPKIYHRMNVSVTPKQDRVFLWHIGIESDATKRWPTLITEIRLAKGAEPTFRRHTLPPLPQPNRSNDWMGALTGLLIPPGLVAGIVGYAAIGDALGNTSTAHMWSDMQRYPSVYFLLSTLSALSGLLSAGLTLLVGRRCAFPAGTRWAWALAVLLLGPFGLLMLLALRDWPARETCSTCGQSRIVTNEQCEHCGARFSLPPRDGTEIFEAVR